MATTGGGDSRRPAWVERMQELSSFDGDVAPSRPSSPPGAAPSPPPPPPFYGAPPNYGGWWGTGWSGSPGAGTLDAVRELKKSIRYYQIYLLLTILVVLVSVGLLGSVLLGSTSSLLSPSSLGASGSPSSGAGALIAAALLLGVLGLGALILLLLAWITWLGGSNKLAQHAAEFGPQAAASARAARTDWTLATAVWFVNLLAGIALAVVVAVAIASSLGPITNRSLTSPPPPVDLSQFAGLLVVGSAVSAILTFFLYWFATRGLLGGLAPLASPEIRGEAESARKIILIGAILSVAGAAGYVVPIVRLAALVSPVFLLYGFWRLGEAYDRWLAHPPTPGPGVPLTSAPDYARPYG